MEDRIVKLKGLELENFKNVKYGKIDFKEDRETGKISNILGIYGQNGSGKTSVINALYLFRMVISGQKLNPNFCNFISCEKNSAALGFEFRIIDKGETYRVFYKFELRKTYKSGAFPDDLSMEYNEMLDLSENIGNSVEYNKVTDINNSSEMNLENDKVLGMDEHRIISVQDDKDITVEVFREKLSYSKWEENQWRKSITIVDYDMDDEDYTFRPIKNYREAANSTDKKVGENSTSFIFSPKTFSLLLTSFAKTSPENSKILAILRNFAIFNIFVIQNDELGAITSNRMIPLSFMLENKKVNMRGNIGLNLFGLSVIDMDKLETVKKILEQINVVLNTLVPKLKIEIKNYGKETLNNSKEAFKVELLSMRNGRKIPLKYESDGIKKIISILSVLIGMYNNENILVAVDELDAGIFEYLLGEILEILSKSAKGQLIFTSHNLRALEKLNKELVVFTTTNENNRYISLNNANVVLNTLVPKLKIEIKNYGKETLNNSKEAFKVELLSVRNGRKIPLKYESEGIKKIISILSVLIGMYNNENILVAVDELDAGIFEYLLGEILEILSKSAKGQLIFTSHNLRALEKLNKELVVFTTTNENNRYISLNNAKVGNNLRDFYYRGIMLGGQKENLYDETNKYEINYAFRKAWMLGNGNS